MNDQKATHHRNDGSLTAGDQQKAPISPSSRQRRWLSILLLSLAMCGHVTRLLALVEELHRDPSRYEDPLHHKREEAEQ